MEFESSGVGCSVTALYELTDPKIPVRRTFKDPWSGRTYKDWDYENAVDLLDDPEKGLENLKKWIADENPCGVIIFADNVTQSKEHEFNGEKLAKLLKKYGYKVEQTDYYVNRNHFEKGHKNPDKCRMWVWYWQSPRKKVAGNERINKSSVRNSRGSKGSKTSG